MATFDDVVAPYVDACARASLRTQRVMTLMVFLAILMFAGMWKQQPFSWFTTFYSAARQAADYRALEKKQVDVKQRIDACQEIRAHLEAMEDEMLEKGQREPLAVAAQLQRRVNMDARCGQVASKHLVEVVRILTSASDQHQAILRARQSVDQEMTGLSKRSGEMQRTLDSEGLELGRKMITIWRRGDENAAAAIDERIAETFKQTYAARVVHGGLFQVPILGLTFHVNDLGLIAGLTTFVLLIWVRVALEDERSALTMTRDAADRALTDDMSGATRSGAWQRGRAPVKTPDGRRARRRIYERLSLQQLFYSPPPVGSTQSHGTKVVPPWVVEALVIALIAIEAAVVWDDLASTETLKAVNYFLYITEIVTNGSLLLANLYIASRAIQSARALRRDWAALHGWASAPPPPSPDANGRLRLRHRGKLARQASASA